MQNIYGIVAIIIGSGILGGIVTYLKSERKNLERHILTSLIACGIVPLFLHLVSSRLVYDILAEPKNDETT